LVAAVIVQDPEVENCPKAICEGHDDALAIRRDHGLKKKWIAAPRRLTQRLAVCTYPLHLPASCGCLPPDTPAIQYGETLEDAAERNGAVWRSRDRRLERDRPAKRGLPASNRCAIKARSRCEQDVTWLGVDSIGRNSQKGQCVSSEAERPDADGVLEPPGPEQKNVFASGRKLGQRWPPLAWRILRSRLGSAAVSRGLA